MGPYGLGGGRETMPRGYGETAVVEFSQEELQDMLSAVRRQKWRLADRGLDNYSGDYRHLQERIEESLDKVREGEGE